MQALEKIQGEIGQAFFQKAYKAYSGAGFETDLAYAKAWRDLQAQGYKPDVVGLWKLNERTLVSHDDKTSKMPLVYDKEALSNLRADQVPRFLGALTHPEIHPAKRFKFEDLTAIQNRVDTQKVTEISALKDKSGPAGIVGLFSGKAYILDGHHRTVGRWLAGEADVEMRYVDLNPVTNAMKHKDESYSISQKIEKIDNDQRLVFGWASVIEKDGKPVIDHHGDIIDESELLQAAHKFMSSSRMAKAMHEGGQVAEFVESVVFTKDIQKALGIDLGKVGWWVGAKVSDEQVWKSIKSGQLRMFSIGGSASRIDNDQ